MNRRLGLLAALASRIYVGAHHPQDVLTGYALGAVVSIAGYPLLRKPLAWLLGILAGNPLRVLIVPRL